MKKTKLSDYDYELPSDLIAKQPVRPRDYSRLLVLDRKSGQIKHHTFYEVVDFLKSSDLLVMNDSKVFPARLIGKKESGGRVEILLDKQLSKNIFEAIGKNLKINNVITFARSRIKCYILSTERGVYKVKFSMFGNGLFSELEKIGQIPLPPYILKARGKGPESNLSDKVDYQTVYAKTKGSSAAPTAGLHFTEELLEKIKNKGIEIEKVTLHVGLGTFAPVRSDDISKHKIHSEYFSVDRSVWDKIREAKKAGRRIVAVGTTSTRVIEHLARVESHACRQAGRKSKVESEGREKPSREVGSGSSGVGFSSDGKRKTCLPAGMADNGSRISGWTDIFIYPGYKFKIVDALITNFHLPKSTLLMLVSAFAGSNLIKKAYAEAIENKYRFYSYGDAMLIK